MRSLTKLSIVAFIAVTASWMYLVRKQHVAIAASTMVATAANELLEQQEYVLGQRMATNAKAILLSYENWYLPSDVRLKKEAASNELDQIVERIHKNRDKLRACLNAINDTERRSGFVATSDANQASPCLGFRQITNMISKILAQDWRDARLQIPSVVQLLDQEVEQKTVAHQLASIIASEQEDIRIWTQRIGETASSTWKATMSNHDGAGHRTCAISTSASSTKASHAQCRRGPAIIWHLYSPTRIKSVQVGDRFPPEGPQDARDLPGAMRANYRHPFATVYVTTLKELNWSYSNGASATRYEMKVWAFRWPEGTLMGTAVLKQDPPPHAISGTHNLYPPPWQPEVAELIQKLTGEEKARAEFKPQP